MVTIPKWVVLWHCFTYSRLFFVLYVFDHLMSRQAGRLKLW